MIVTSSAIIFLNVFSLCLGQEDLSGNLIRDPVELGNPYPLANTRSNGQYGNMVKRKHQSYRRPISSSTTNPHLSFSSSSQTSSSEESASLTAKNNTVVEENPVQKVNATRQRDGHVHGHHHSGSSEHSNEESCPMCEAARRNARVDDETLRALRVEIVKRQILKKLRLDEPPKMDNVPRGHNTVLPPIALGNHPVLSNSIRDDNDDDVDNLDLEDFYGKTEQIIVLPQDELSNCATWSNRARAEAASCFLFNLPKEVRSNQIEIGSAELWVFKLSDADTEAGTPALLSSAEAQQHNFSVSEIVTVKHSRSSTKQHGGSSIHFNLITARSDIPKSGGWFNFNITHKVRKWLSTEAHEHSVKISCSTCSRDVNEFPFVSAGEQQPFIVFNIANGKRRRRNKRSINCGHGITECCRESLYVSFEEIQWHWVLEPKGFDAFFCKGGCHGDNALAHSGKPHFYFVQIYI